MAAGMERFGEQEPLRERAGKPLRRRLHAWLRGPRPADRLTRWVFWFLLAYLVLFFPRMLPGAAGAVFRVASSVDFLLLLGSAALLLARFVLRRLLWKVRDRLIVTYLLMGLAPLVLFATLAGISAYVFTGQFAIFAATSEIDSELAHLQARNAVFARHAAYVLGRNPAAVSLDMPEFEAGRSQQSALGLAVFHAGRRLDVSGPAGGQPAIHSLPSWAYDGFHGIVIDDGQLSLRALDLEELPGGDAVTVVSSLPLSGPAVAQVATGLGRVVIVPSFEFAEDGSERRSRPAAGGAGRQPRGEQGSEAMSAVSGGTLPRPKTFYDGVVAFWAPLPTVDWASGRPRLIRIDVYSRPSLLYRRLFITSLRIATFVQDALIVIAAVFALLELFALVMAIRLNQTITTSIHDLYRATEEIDRGNFGHRIAVRRNDQLAALSRSFNQMTDSIARLLEQQREKERLESELEIAQQVQANLFPRGDQSLPTLELHGICRPARTVSGDY
jgi:sigma-B regulation protein RsbU (phosphoserine phosphatase)